MISNKILIVIAIVMLGYALSSQTGCDGKTLGAILMNNTPPKKEDCISETDSYQRCCFATYKIDGNSLQSCQTMTNAEFLEFNARFEAFKLLYPDFEDPRLDCGQSFITLSFIVLALFALLF